jgi:hypothetical protein
MTTGSALTPNPATGTDACCPTLSKPALFWPAAVAPAGFFRLFRDVLLRQQERRFARLRSATPKRLGACAGFLGIGIEELF